MNNHANLDTGVSVRQDACLHLIGVSRRKSAVVADAWHTGLS